MQKETDSSSRKAIFISLGIFGFIGLTCGGGCLLFAGGIFAVTEAPAQEAKAFLRDLREDDVEGAYARMSPSYRAQRDLAAFRAEIGTMPALLAHSDDTVMGRSVSDDRATMTIALETTSGDEQIVIELEQQSERWYVRGVDPS